MRAAAAARNPGAAIAQRSAQTELQNTIGTASTKNRESHLEPSVTLRAQMEQDSAATPQRPKPPRKGANLSWQRNLRLPEKNTMFRANPNIQIASLM